MDKLRIVLAIAGFLFGMQDLWSRHIVGGDITYEYIGDNPNGAKRYRFTMHLFRDCNGGGANFDDPAQMAIYSGNWSNAVLQESFITFDPEIAPIVISSACNGGSVNFLCLEQAVYTFERDIPASTNESYFIVYQRCCRAATLSNIISPDQGGSSIMVELTPMAMTLNNSSPVLPAYPPVALCIHHPLNIIQTATDKENDQLTYSFAAPLAGGGPMLNVPEVTGCQGALPTPPCGPPYDLVQYIVPVYSPQAPLAGDPIIEINPVTGVITGTPRTLGQFLTGITLQEFRDNILISTIRREITFTVFDAAATSIMESNPDATTFRVFPNPANGWINWSSTLEIEEIRVFDCIGQCLIRKQGQNLTQLDTKTLEAGFYLLIGTTSSGIKISSALLVAR